MSWEDFDAILARVEDRDEATGRNKPLKANVAARNGMKRLYAERIAKGLNAHGKPLVSPEKRNHRYGFNHAWKMGTYLNLSDRHKPWGVKKYRVKYYEWRKSPLFVRVGDFRFDDNFARFTKQNAV